MPRLDLVQRLDQAGCLLLRHGGKPEAESCQTLHPAVTGRFAGRRRPATNSPRQRRILIPAWRAAPGTSTRTVPGRKAVAAARVRLRAPQSHCPSERRAMRVPLGTPQAQTSIRPAVSIAPKFKLQPPENPQYSPEAIRLAAELAAEEGGVPLRLRRIRRRESGTC